MILGQPDFSVQPTGAKPDGADVFLCFQGRDVLMNGACLPTLAQAQALLPDAFEPFELAHTSGCTLFSPHPYAGVSVVPAPPLALCDLNVFRSLPGDTAALIASGWHLWNWYQTSRFCGRCGHENVPDAAERALRCPRCGHVLYPVISPAVIVAITCGDQILLAKSARGNFRRFALIAGYVEVGETLEHALRREVKEEVGLDLLSVRYLGDQPWGVSGSQMFAFHAVADDRQPLCLQKSELAEARWFRRDELAPADNTVSIAFEMIERFRLGTL